ncbi:MAG: RnfABCDGE type electron transport complex subunit C, partial [Lachnospiraceae bacterium]|nr:RnfABCDGE type electron transport complex subunit C [Lachnospiraceae bacterium]
PYITSDDMLLRMYPDRVLEGMRIICQVLNPERVVLAIEENKKEAIEVLKKELANDKRIELVVLPTRYPQGAEKQLVQAVTGSEIPGGELPKSVGAAVFNVATFAYTYGAVCLGRPVTRRIVTVSGEAVKNPGNYWLRIGTGFEYAVAQAGGLKENAWKVIAGGPMMGVAQEDLSACTIKGTNCILCLSEEQNGEAKEENPCIRCGACVKACPMNLQPLYLYAYGKKQNTDELKRLNVTDCIECGCCSYTCPSKLHLVETIREGKVRVKEEM